MVKIVDKILQDSLDGFIKERDEAKQRISELNEYIFELNQELKVREVKEPVKSNLGDDKKLLSSKQRILNYLEDITKPESTREIHEALGDINIRTVGSSLSKLVKADKVCRHDTLPFTWSRKRG